MVRAQERLELRDTLFERIEVRRVRREVFDLRARCCDQRAGPGGVMETNVVQQHAIPQEELRDQAALDL